MLVLKSSAALPRSKEKPAAPAPKQTAIPAPLSEALGVAIALAALGAAAMIWVQMHGYTLYYGDAEAHLNIARRFVESRTPGYGQVGTVWLPLPHVLMLPFILNNWLWRTGLAGAIPACACFVVAAMALYLVARQAFHSRAAALTGVALFALNPNILYLQSIPMTETVFFAGLLGMLFGTMWYRRSQSTAAIVVTALFSIAASLTRYEGWFLIPFVTLYFAFASKGPRGGAFSSARWPRLRRFTGSRTIRGTTATRSNSIVVSTRPRRSTSEHWMLDSLVTQATTTGRQPGCTFERRSGMSRAGR